MSDRLWLRVLFIAASMGLAGNHLEIITESPAGSAGLFWPATMLFSWGFVAGVNTMRLVGELARRAGNEHHM